MNKIIHTLFLLLVTNSVLATGHRFGAFRHIDARQGLPSNYIRVIDCDTMGLVWIGTGNGVATFDGYRVRKVAFACGHNHDVLALDANRAQPLAYTSDSVYEWRNSMFVPIREADSSELPAKKFPLNADFVKNMNGWAEDGNGNLWVSILSKGLAFVQPSGDVAYMHDDENAMSFPGVNTTTVKVDSRGLVWVGTTTRGLSWAPASGNGAMFIPVWEKEDMSFVYRDRSGRSLVGFDGGGVRIDDWILNKANGTLPSDFALNIIDLDNGRFLLGTYGGGIVEIDVNKHSVRPLRWTNDDERAVVDNVRGMQIDARGRLWIASFHKGLAMAVKNGDGVWHIEKHYRVENSDMPNQTISDMSLNIQGNELGVATPHGMARVNLNTLELRRVPECQDMLMACITSFNNKWWIGSMNGLTWIDANNNTSGVVKEINEPIIGAASNGSNVLYAISYNSLWTLTDLGNGTFYVNFENLNWLTNNAGLVAYALSVCADGTVLAGSRWGFVEVKPGTKTLGHRYAIRFMGFAVDNQHVDAGQRLPKGLPVDVEISDLSYWEYPRFEYSLDGGPWLMVDGGTIHLGALRAGFYDIKVRYYGIPSEEYTLSFQVGTWFQHWTFITFLWLFGIAAVICAFTYIWKRLRAKKPYEVRAVAVEPEEETSDVRFLRKVAEVVEANMKDEAFGVEQLSAELGMSRTTLFRRLKSLTGQTPFDLIQGMRLERGRELLAQKDQTVQAVAWAVGMNPRQFSIAYKKQYGHAPTKTAQ